MLTKATVCLVCNDTGRGPVCGGVGSHAAPQGENEAKRRVCRICHATGRCRECASEFPAISSGDKRAVVN